MLKQSARLHAVLALLRLLLLLLGGAMRRQVSKLALRAAERRNAGAQTGRRASGAERGQRLKERRGRLASLAEARRIAVAASAEAGQTFELQRRMMLLRRMLLTIGKLLLLLLLLCLRASLRQHRKICDDSGIHRLECRKSRADGSGQRRLQ